MWLHTMRTLAALLLAAGPAAAIDTVEMNLAQLAARANRIFTGRVIDVRAGTVEAGGGVRPVTIYRVQVADTFCGAPPLHGRYGRSPPPD